MVGYSNSHLQAISMIL